MDNLLLALGGIFVAVLGGIFALAIKDVDAFKRLSNGTKWLVPRFAAFVAIFSLGAQSQASYGSNVSNSIVFVPILLLTSVFFWTWLVEWIFGLWKW